MKTVNTTTKNIGSALLTVMRCHVYTQCVGVSVVLKQLKLEDVLMPSGSAGRGSETDRKGASAWGKAGCLLRN